MTSDVAGDRFASVVGARAGAAPLDVIALDDGDYARRHAAGQELARGCRNGNPGPALKLLTEAVPCMLDQNPWAQAARALAEHATDLAMACWRPTTDALADAFGLPRAQTQGLQQPRAFCNGPALARAYDRGEGPVDFASLQTWALAPVRHGLIENFTLALWPQTGPQPGQDILGLDGHIGRIEGRRLLAGVFPSSPGPVADPGGWTAQLREQVARYLADAPTLELDTDQGPVRITAGWRDGEYSQLYSVTDIETATILGAGLLVDLSIAVRDAHKPWNSLMLGRGGPSPRTVPEALWPAVEAFCRHREALPHPRAGS